MSIIPEGSPSARILWAASLGAAPGCCAISGVSQHEKGFIDTGQDFDEWGRVYYSYDVVAEMANLFGFATPEQVESYDSRYSDVILENQELTKQLEALEEIRDAVAKLGIILNPSDDSGRSAFEDLEESPVGAVEDSAGDERPVNESDSGEGLSRIPNIGIKSPGTKRDPNSL